MHKEGAPYRVRRCAGVDEGGVRYRVLGRVRERGVDKARSTRYRVRGRCDCSGCDNSKIAKRDKTTSRKWSLAPLSSVGLSSSRLDLVYIVSSNISKTGQKYRYERDG